MPSFSLFYLAFCDWILLSSTVLGMVLPVLVCFFFVFFCFTILSSSSPGGRGVGGSRMYFMYFANLTMPTMLCVFFYLLIQLFTAHFVRAKTFVFFDLLSHLQLGFAVNIFFCFLFYKYLLFHILFCLFININILLLRTLLVLFSC